MAVKAFQKKKKCRKCGTTGNQWNKWKLMWANGSYEYGKDDNIKDQFVVCWDCSDKLRKWVCEK
jgi:hypothetical protein